MIIKIDENWRINIDEARNHAPERRKVNKKTGAEYYDALGYYSNAEGALGRIVAENVIEKSGNEISLFEYVTLLREERKRFEDILKEALRYS